MSTLSFSLRCVLHYCNQFNAKRLNQIILLIAVLFILSVKTHGNYAAWSGREMIEAIIEQQGEYAWDDTWNLLEQGPNYGQNMQLAQHWGYRDYTMFQGYLASGVRGYLSGKPNIMASLDKEFMTSVDVIISRFHQPVSGLAQADPFVFNSDSSALIAPPTSLARSENYIDWGHNNSSVEANFRAVLEDVKNFNISSLNKVSERFYHYTTASGIRGILSTKSLNPSLFGTFGPGQYFTPVKPENYNEHQDQLGVFSATHFIEVRALGLNIEQSRFMMGNPAPNDFHRKSMDPLELGRYQLVRFGSVPQARRY